MIVFVVPLVLILTRRRRLLSRAHSNYLAQINIRMNERQEQTADVLGKLTVLGTIVLPMNIITGMWGMNVLVPGQDVQNLFWFWSSKFDPSNAGGVSGADRSFSDTFDSHRRLDSVWCFVFLHCEKSIRDRLRTGKSERSGSWKR